MTWQTIAGGLVVAALAIVALGAYANYQFVKRIVEREDSQ